MGSKVSELNSLNSTEYAKLELGLIPIVIEDSLGTKHTKKFTLLEYWELILQDKVINECKQQKSIYNFGGEVINPGGGTSGEGGSTPGGSGGSGGESSTDIIALTTRIERLENFTTSEAPNIYYLKTSGEELASTVNEHSTALTTVNNLLTDYNTRLGNIESKIANPLIIKVVDKEGNLVNGYSYSPSEGLISNVIEFPAGSYIQLRTDELARAMYRLELATAVTAVYSVDDKRYVITIGPLTLSKPKGITQYSGGSFEEAYITITPSWDSMSSIQENLSFGSSIVGTHTMQWYYPSDTDQLIGSNTFTIFIKIGNWSLTFTLTNNMTITGNIVTDITAAR